MILYFIEIIKEYHAYLKELIKKYKIKQKGNLLRRLAFNINTDNNNTVKFKQQHSKFITAVIQY